MKGVRIQGQGNLIKNGGVVLNTDTEGARAALQARIFNEEQTERIKNLEEALQLLLAEREDKENG